MSISSTSKLNIWRRLGGSEVSEVIHGNYLGFTLVKFRGNPVLDDRK